MYLSEMLVIKTVLGVGRAGGRREGKGERVTTCHTHCVTPLPLITVSDSGRKVSGVGGVVLFPPETVLSRVL